MARGHGVRLHQAHDCPTCPLKPECTRAGRIRQICVSPILLRYKAQVRKRLATPAGERMLKKRGVEVESVWGHIKEERQLRRFLLRGLAKVQTEWGILIAAHNLLKSKQAALAH